MMPDRSRLRSLLRPLLLLALPALCSPTVDSAQSAAKPPVVAPAPNGPIPKPIPLYNGQVPGALGHTPADTPVLYPFLPAAGQGLRAAVLVIPGGGYVHVALGHEGFQFAEWLNAQGVAAYVLDYRVAPYHYPAEVQDGAAAMRYIRAHAPENGIDPDRIGVWGSSAGGSLAAILSTKCTVADSQAAPTPAASADCRPNFAILSYPVIAMEAPLAHAGSRQNLLGPNPSPELARTLSPQYAVSSTTPPTFLFATSGDPTVPVGNSVAMYQALLAKGIPAEMHVFDYANHGCGLCGDIPRLSVWPMLLRTWLEAHNVVLPDAPPPPPPAQNMQDWPSGLDGPGHAQ